jgi:hypothetical protein
MMEDPFSRALEIFLDSGEELVCPFIQWVKHLNINPFIKDPFEIVDFFFQIYPRFESDFEDFIVSRCFSVEEDDGKIIDLREDMRFFIEHYRMEGINGA